MNHTHPVPHARGYSLVELMIVLVVLSVGILALARMLPTASREQLHDRMRTSASYYAQEKVESLRTLSMSSADLTTGRHPSASTNETVGAKNAYRRYWTVAPLPDPLANLLRVDVVVSWTSNRGRDSVVATSYVNF